VPECEGDQPRPQVQTWSGSQHSLNILPRWPNTTGWPSAWQLDGRHVLRYNISDGWQTSLVTHNHSGSLGSADFWFMGSQRVVYSNVTWGVSTFSVPGWPQSSQWNVSHDVYNVSAASASRRFYFATRPFNTTQAYMTTHQVWGNFTVFVTHLSNNDTVIACHDSNYTSVHAAGSTSNCSAVAGRHLQCPFTFRCYHPEMAGGSGPRCMDDFDNGYNDTDVQNTLPNNTSPKDVYGAHGSWTAMCIFRWILCTIIDRLCKACILKHRNGVL
jgi:hypothetical protein